MKANTIYISILALTFCFFAGCDDNVDPLVTELKTSRQFVPATITVTGGQTEAVIQWKASIPTGNGERTYAVEVSTDEAFSVIAYSLTTAGTEAVVTNQDIEIKKDYYARVKTIGAEGTEDSGWKVSEVFQITGEQIFLAVTEADLTFNSVNLRWTPGGTVTKITLTSPGGTPVEFTITEEERTAGIRTITGLIPGTTYTAEIFGGETSRGTTSFTTLSLNLPPSDLVIYLTGAETFAATTFDTLTKARVTFVLPQGALFGASSGLTLKASTDIAFYGIPGVNKPVMAFNGFTLPATGGKIRFENVDLTGYPDGVSGTKRAYIFNQSAATQTAEVVFENCIIRNFENTPFRIQGSNAIAVEKLVVSNSIIYDISAGGQNYAFINVTNANGKVNNIEITNSTFYNVKIGILLFNPAVNSQSLTVSNCTINDITADTRAVIDTRAATVGTFTFANNILGKVKGTTGTIGIRIANASVSVPSNSYTTSDFTVTSNPIGGVSAYAGASTALFADPANGDFHFKDGNFAGKNTAGDPRWKP